MRTETQNKRYNGWKNYASWNCALWIGNDMHLYFVARDCIKHANYCVDRAISKFLDYTRGEKTGDGVPYTEENIREYFVNEMDEMMEEDYAK
jgi:hypothetical protein